MEGIVDVGDPGVVAIHRQQVLGQIAAHRPEIDERRHFGQDVGRKAPRSSPQARVADHRLTAGRLFRHFSPGLIQQAAGGLISLTLLIIGSMM